MKTSIPPCRKIWNPRVEVDIQVGGPGIIDLGKTLLQERLDGLDQLLPDIGRIRQNHIEPAPLVGKRLGKLDAPINDAFPVLRSQFRCADRILG